MSGADPIETRPGFASLLDRIEGNGVRTVIVEDASRFARELVTQELGILALIEGGAAREGEVSLSISGHEAPIERCEHRKDSEETSYSEYRLHRALSAFWMSANGKRWS